MESDEEITTGISDVSPAAKETLHSGGLTSALTKTVDTRSHTASADWDPLHSSALPTGMFFLPFPLLVHLWWQIMHNISSNNQLGSYVLCYRSLQNLLRATGQHYHRELTNLHYEEVN
jgi:hypothetical protein